MMAARHSLLLLLSLLALHYSSAFLTSTPALRSSSSVIAMKCSASKDGEKAPLSRRDFMAASVPVASALVLASPGNAEEVEVKKEPEVKKEKLLIYGQDANQVLAEVGVTGFGFFIVFAPTLLRSFGMMETPEELQAKYPDRLWTIDGKEADGTPASGLEDKEDSPSSGKSL